jgi:hypothetical protein
MPGLAPKAGESVPAPNPEDKYKDRLLKYIPAEVVTFYLSLTAIVGAATDVPGWLSWTIFVVGIFATPFYLRFYARVSDHTQLSISTLAFIVWVFALGGPFKEISWYKPVYGGVLLPIFTFFVAGVRTPPNKRCRNLAMVPRKGSLKPCEVSEKGCNSRVPRPFLSLASPAW